MDERLTRIRESERKSHTEIYTNEKLYSTDSWLQRPIKTVREIASLLEGYPDLRVLDLGCGVGRNCIHIAERFRENHCVIDCVDLLEVAVEKLLKNAKEHNVEDSIRGICKAIEEYEVPKETYDFIMAVSALEHMDTHESFVKKLVEIKDGLREKGIVCLVINSNVMERNAETNEVVEAQFDLNFATEKLQNILAEVFAGWKVLKTSVVAQEYEIPREAFISHLTTDVVTFVAGKRSF